MAINKKALYIVGGISLLGIAGFLYWKHKNKKDDGTKTPEATPVTKISVISDNAPINTGTINPENNVHIIPAPTPPAVNNSAKPPMIGKMLVAKYNGGSIYDPALVKVDVTKIGTNLGIATDAILTTNGSYQISFRDGQGRQRKVNSAAVKY